MKCMSKGCERDAVEGRLYCELHKLTGAKSHGRNTGHSRNRGNPDSGKQKGNPSKRDGNPPKKSEGRSNPPKR